MDTAAGPMQPRVAMPHRRLALRERVTRVTVWLGGSLHRRFVTVSLGLLLIVQLASFLVIQGSLNRHMLDALPEQLSMGARTLQRMIDWRSQRLIEGARLLAADYGFRAAVQSNDRETIASVLANHGARIGASEVALLDLRFNTVGTAEGSVWNERSGAATAARLAARSGSQGGAAEITVAPSGARQAVLVPLKAPTLVGWVMMYFPIRPTMRDDVHDLAAVDLTVMSRAGPEHPWQVTLSRLAPQVAEQLAAMPWPQANGAGDGAGMHDVVAGDTRLGVQTAWLTAADARGPGHPEVIALLAIPVQAALRPPRNLQAALLVTTLLGFAAFAVASAYMARRITTPLQSLVGAAERLGAGDSTSPIRPVAGHDEVQELARALERMRASLVAQQEKVIQSEKLASIGQLAAGVAHEINNPIGFVFSNFGTLQQYLDGLFRMLAAYQEAEAGLAGSPTAQRLARLRADIELDYLREDIPALMSESREGLTRVRKIVQDLKDFSHVDARHDWETVDLHAGLDLTLNIVANEVRYKADIVKQYGQLPPVECLPHELNQVFMNLVVNAAHAMGAERGTITLRSGSTHDQAWVEVADNGSGIARDDLKRIFDPFFTTKPVGKGTGLGLSLSYGIVRKHGGRIDVTSEVGRGTAFRVWIPLRRDPGASEAG